MSNSNLNKHSPDHKEFHTQTMEQVQSVNVCILLLVFFNILNCLYHVYQYKTSANDFLWV